MKNKKLIWPAVIGGGAILGLLFALLMPSSWLLVPRDYHDHDDDHAANGDTFYACPMFCTRSDEPGICPVCGMDMEPFEDTGDVVPLDPRKRNAIGLLSEPIQRRLLARELRTLGTFEPDETRQKVVAAWVDGRIDRLYADFTGVPVEKGWHLFDLYSPQLYSAQQELIVARNAAAREGAGRDAERMLEIAREKLRLLGLASDQIAHLETLNEPQLTLTIPAPDNGVVLERLASVGMYVKQGQPVFRIADLSRLWLIVNVHERDQSFVALGQPVSVQVNAYPGRSFEGRVGFIEPALDPKTRTVRVRVEVPNPDGDLRPEMFGTARIFAELGRDGRAVAPELPGDYACPMHPLQRGDSHEGHCPICGMAYVPDKAREGGRPAPVWAIPREAVLSTGVRDLVFVEWWVRRDQSHLARPEILKVPEYESMEVKLGPLAAEYDKATGRKLREYYPYLEGKLPTGAKARMPDGDKAWKIVTNGQFLIDSQMELTGKPSLMRPEGGKAADPHAGMDMGE